MAVEVIEVEGHIIDSLILAKVMDVILAAGAVASPKILELSGVGDGARLQDLGIPVARHLPGVVLLI